MTGAHAALITLLSMHAPVELRGGRMVMAPIVDISANGVQVGGDEPRVIAWDNVRSVDAEWADRAEPYRQISDDAWRARNRLARGDTILAAPLFERLFPEYRDERGSLALMIAEGVYRCRYGSGDTAGAFEAWLVAANLREHGIAIDGDPPMTPLLDLESRLPPKVPPIFIDTPETRATADAASHWLIVSDADDSSTLRPIVDAYLRAARLASDANDPQATPIKLTEHQGQRLVALIANAQHTDQNAREDARSELQKYCSGDTVGTWREAWARAAIGSSLLMESERDQRIGGVIELLHLPARFADSQPHLTAIALAKASNALADLDDKASARRLREELSTLAPHHEAISWLDQQTENQQPERSPDGDPS